jgi:transposase
MNKEFIRQNVGIDIAKDDFKVNFSVLTPELDVVVKGTKTFENNRQGFVAFNAWAEDNRSRDVELHFTMEATGVYYENSAYFLHERGYTVHVVLPNQAKKYGQSLGVESKTDRIDSKTLAQMGLERKLRRWEPFSSHFQKLKRLTRERDTLIEDRTMAFNQLHAFESEGQPVKATVRRSQEHIAFLNEQIKEIESDITSVIEADQPLQERLNCVLSIKGVGLITAVTVVAETNGFAMINNIKQLTSYAGLNVKIRESGKWKGKSKISKQGNRYIRKALYFPTFVMLKYDKATREKYERLKEKKGIPMVAAVARQRKLLGLIYTLWKKKEMYCPDFETIQKTSGNAAAQASPLAFSEGGYVEIKTSKKHNGAKKNCGA